ncbi:hypothetical protein H6P81_015322 [Aristolochia fimbriata]|uniref:Filament-like plant protein n=1 Tax=Aristolochia fimbriata TaxID=158543 RepID=A0AAV7E8Z8_ARIFI|nr:hypothetical protein H6P81_015322 [Aristolochia fimbriata]
MDRRSWLWRRKSSEKSPGETESSGSVSSLSERFSDEQEALRASPNHAQSPEVSSNPSGGEAIDIDKNSHEKLSDSKKPLIEKLAADGDKTLTDKLSAALLNIRAKEDLVKQHAKVAEEAVTGWEKAEKEAAILKLQLEATVQKNNALEDRIGHLDGALKECVRQLRHAREEQEQKIHEAVAKKVQEFESLRVDLEKQLSGLQTQLDAAKAEASSSSLDLDFMSRLEEVEKENSALKLELLVQSEELKIKTLERDLSTQAAEAASKQHLESIKKVTKLEAECQRLRFLGRKASASGNDQKQVSSANVESLTDSQSDGGDRLNQLEADVRKLGSLELNEGEPSCSDSWASALIAELDQFRSDKTSSKNLTASSAEFGLMDDFLEMERLVALPEAEEGNREEGNTTKQPSSRSSSPSRSELEAVVQRAAELEGKLQRLEEEKAGLERSLDETHDQLEKSRTQLIEAEEKIVELQRELEIVKDLKQASEKEVENANTNRKMVQLQLEAADAEAQVLRAKVDSLEMDVDQERTLSAAIKVNYEKLEAELEHEKALSEEIKIKCQNLEKDIEQEKSLSAEIKVKCQNLEKEISRKREMETRLAATSNGELKLKQEKELAVAAGKLSECQKTIASLGRQLKSLATLEDFLLDPEMPELKGLSLPQRAVETKASHSGNESYLSKIGTPKLVGVPSNPQNGKDDSPPSSSSSSSSSGNHGVEKARNGIGKLFSRSRSSIYVDNH